MNVQDLAALTGLGYWPRISQHNGRSVEQALAPPSLFDPGLRLDGAVVEATYAVSKPHVLGRLREDQTPYVIDPQAVRFLSPSYQDVQALQLLPYAPQRPLTPESEVEDFVRRSLELQATANASAYIVPSVWTLAAEYAWDALNARIIRSAVQAQGASVPSNPIIAYVAPDTRSLGDPHRVLGPLSDWPLAAVYVQPTALNPVRDSVEKLVRYVRFLQAAMELGVPVIAGRLGAFGLVLQAVGIPYFDSGLGEAESFNLTQQNRTPRPRADGRGVHGRRRVYIGQLKTTLMARDAEAILVPDLRARFVCTLPCHRETGFEDFASRARAHYLYSRMREVEALAALPSMDMRAPRVHEDLLTASSHAAVVRRTLIQQGVRAPDFGHLDRWNRVLSRVTGVSVAA